MRFMGSRVKSAPPPDRRLTWKALKFSMVSRSIAAGCQDMGNEEAYYLLVHSQMRSAGRDMLTGVEMSKIGCVVDFGGLPR